MSALASTLPKADCPRTTKNGLSASKFRALAPPLYRARVSRASVPRSFCTGSFVGAARLGFDDVEGVLINGGQAHLINRQHMPSQAPWTNGDNDGYDWQ